MTLVWPPMGPLIGPLGSAPIGPRWRLPHEVVSDARILVAFEPETVAGGVATEG